LAYNFYEEFDAVTPTASNVVHEVLNVVHLFLFTLELLNLF